MAQFLIKDAVKFSFATYRKHFTLLLMVSIIVGASLQVALMVPHYVSQQLGVKHFHLVHGDVASTGLPYEQAQADLSNIERKVSQNLFALISAYVAQTRADYLVIVGLVTALVWVWYLFLLLGCMRLGLALVDTDRGSLKLLLQSSLAQVMKFLVFFLFYCAYVWTIFRFFAFLGAIVQDLVKAYCDSEVLLPVFYPVMVISIFAMLYLMVTYVFFGYCIVDNPAIGLDSTLKVSGKLIAASQGRIVCAIFLFISCAALLGYLVNVAVLVSGAAGAIGYHHEIVTMLCGLVTIPCAISYFSYIYRLLSKK